MPLLQLPTPDASTCPLWSQPTLSLCTSRTRKAVVDCSTALQLHTMGQVLLVSVAVQEPSTTFGGHACRTVLTPKAGHNLRTTLLL